VQPRAHVEHDEAAVRVVDAWVVRWHPTDGTQRLSIETLGRPKRSPKQARKNGVTWMSWI
jgi:hypothetical protein